MTPALLLLAGAIARPRGHRPTCPASSWTLTLGATDGCGRACCPRCGCNVTVTDLFSRVVSVDTHPAPGGTR